VLVRQTVGTQPGTPPSTGGSQACAAGHETIDRSNGPPVSYCGRMARGGGGDSLPADPVACGPERRARPTVPIPTGGLCVHSSRDLDPKTFLRKFSTLPQDFSSSFETRALQPDSRLVGFRRYRALLATRELYNSVTAYALARLTRKFGVRWRLGDRVVKFCALTSDGRVFFTTAIAA